MDIWEANSISSAFTAHPCQVDGHTRCEGAQCGDDSKGQRFQGVCDKDGCDLNAYRAGVKDFFGPNKTVDTTKKMTVVTQFITSDGTDDGDVVEIRRKFVQDGKVIEHPKSNIPGLDSQYDSLKDDMCENVKQKFGDTNDFKNKGGMKKMSDSLGKGMVLVMSLWDDHAADMLWLDSTYPVSKTSIGGPRGSCSTDSGKPSDVESQHPDAAVTFSNIKVGEIDSTYPAGPSPGPSPGPGKKCPGGSLSACIGLCPSDPAAAYKACVQTCVSRCPSSAEDVSQFLQ